MTMRSSSARSTSGTRGPPATDAMARRPAASSATPGPTFATSCRPPTKTL
ncbi:MAG: hypothetical protein ACRDYC_06230 [Acidimicrobiales bacterium]